MGVRPDLARLMAAIDAVAAAEADEDEDDGVALRDALAECGAKQKRTRAGVTAAVVATDDDDLRSRQVETLKRLARAAEKALPLLVCPASPVLVRC